MMKRYFNYSDIIVFSISFIGLIWIVCYKSFWMYENSLFLNADRVADVIYTIFTSILASGIFYLFTIFVPRCKLINEMKKDLEIYLFGIDMQSKMIISQIKKGGMQECYTSDHFKECISGDTKKKDLEKDFISSFSSPELIEICIDCITFQIQLINCILSQYSKLLPNNIISNIIKLNSCRSFFLVKNATLPSIFLPPYNLHYTTFLQIYILNEELKKTYTRK